MNVKVYNAWNKPKHKKEDVHQEIYEYDYIDQKSGEVKKAKINIQEKIQSNLERVNYKKQIERGELILDGGPIEQGYRDYTSIPGDKVDFIDFIAKISQLNSEQVNNLVEQVSKGTKNITKEDKQENGQTIDTTKQNQSDNGGSNQESDGGNK